MPRRVKRGEFCKTFFDRMTHIEIQKGDMTVWDARLDKEEETGSVL